MWLFFAAGFVGSEMKSLVDGSSPLFPVHAAPATSAAPARGGRGKKGGSSQPSIEDDPFLYMGTTPTRGRLCISPALTAWVAERQRIEATIYKERRKLAEEIKLLKNNNAGDGEKEASLRSPSVCWPLAQDG